ncbi:hypothetical protein I215_01773 [Galbibacter marinus]|uniref:Uncharacterized protein n=1 Tax=Galbibacter marinus TaxID=555500 RepID=K2Q5Y4_9FLAO|nr:hypothetical protein [Galbibacter marinus]EKF56211.1 hypothetical protein I215_01773 [Galbibacter marinus]
MDTLNIKREAAIAAHKNAKTSGKKLLEDLLGKETFTDIRDLIEDFSDVCEIMGKAELDYTCNSNDPDDIAACALKQALLIARCYNQNRKGKIDWTDHNQPKYCHRYIYNSASGWSLFVVVRWAASSYCGSRLYFIDSDDAKDAWEKFSHIYINLIK